MRYATGASTTMMRGRQSSLKTRLAFVAVGAAAALATWWADESGLLDAHLEAVPKLALAEMR